MQVLLQRKFMLAAALLFFFFGVVSASADPVTFTAGTTGSFGAGSSGGSVANSGTTLTIGGTTITFSSKTNEINVTLDPAGVSSSNVTLGVFNATSTALSAVDGATFTLNVAFTLPSDVAPKPGIYNATLIGKINAGTSGANVVWSTTSLTFNSPSAGTFTLTLEPSTPINAPSSPDASRIRGVINYTNGPAPVPEPLTLITLGSGLTWLAAMRKRKK